MTAGMAGLMALFPADKRPTACDTVGSVVSLNTPFGLSLALATVWSGAGLRIIGATAATWDAESDPNTELALLSTDDQPLPNVLFV